MDENQVYNQSNSQENITDNKNGKKKKEKKYIADTKVPVVNVVVTAIVLAMLIALSAFAVAVFSATPYEVKNGQVDVYELSSKVYTKLVISAMPEKITGNDNGTPVDFYVEVNDDYNYEVNEPIEQYRVYYYNENDEKVPLYKGTYYGRNGEAQYPLLGFFIKSMDNLKVYKKVAIAVLVVVCAAMLALLIYLTVLIVKIVKDKKFYKQYREK